MLTCKEVTMMLTKSLDVPLPLRRRLAVKMHLLLCRFCMRYWRQLQFLETAITRRRQERESSATGIPPQSKEKIQRRILQEIKDE